MSLELVSALTPAATIQERFERFHADHPEVFDGLVQLALEAKARGHKQYSLAAIWEVFRWERNPNDHSYSLNNDYRARYARKIMAKVPELADFFETRVLLRT